MQWVAWSTSWLRERSRDKLTRRDARVKGATGKVLSLEVRRLEKETVKRLDELRNVFRRNPQEARKLIERVLDGELTFTPIEIAEGKRYRIEGRATLALPRRWQTRHATIGL